MEPTSTTTHLCVVALVIELQGELNEPWIVARRDDAPEIAGSLDLAGLWINGSARGVYRVKVADRIGKVYVIKKVEELCAELNVL